jgi:hypothetical protein
MAKFQNKLIDFDQATVPGDVTTHRVYFEAGSPPNYASSFVEFDPAVDVNVPDDVPGFPMGTEVFVAVSAINDDGHESDLGQHPDPFDFTAPPVPIFTVGDAP